MEEVGRVRWREGICQREERKETSVKKFVGKKTNEGRLRKKYRL